MTVDSQEFQGIIDIHAHADPDTTRRSLDVLEMCKLYRDRGFCGVLLMNHWDPTGGQAYLARKAVPGIELWGGIVLNRLVGGINPAAVEHAVRMEGQHTGIVYMPTLDCENEVRWNASGKALCARRRERAAAARGAGDAVVLITQINPAFLLGLD